MFFRRMNPTVRAIFSACDRMDRQYNVSFLSGRRRKRHIKHDLQVMLDHGDLAQVLLQLCAPDGECKMEYGLDAAGQPSTSAAKAIEKTGKLPPLPEPLTAHWMIRRHSNTSPAYEDQLFLQWEDCRHDTDLRRLRVIRTGDKGFSFAETVDAKAPITNVFCHQTNAPTDFAFSVNRTFHARIVRTDRGIQAFDIQA